MLSLRIRRVLSIFVRSTVFRSVQPLWRASTEFGPTRAFDDEWQ